MDSFSFLAGKSFLFIYLFLFVVVSLRSSATFWLGRYATYLLRKERSSSSPFAQKIQAWARSPRFEAGQRKVAKRGWPLITLCFFTIGVQSVILVGAGLARVKGWHFVAAAFPGWIGWALIYSTVGMVALATLWAAILGSVWAWVAIVACLIIGTCCIVWRRSRAHSRKVQD